MADGRMEAMLTMGGEVAEARRMPRFRTQASCGEAVMPGYHQKCGQGVRFMIEWMQVV
jgi:hypothetical protein